MPRMARDPGKQKQRPATFRRRPLDRLTLLIYPASKNGQGRRHPFGLRAMLYWRESAEVNTVYRASPDPDRFIRLLACRGPRY